MLVRIVGEDRVNDSARAAHGRQRRQAAHFARAGALRRVRRDASRCAQADERPAWRGLRRSARSGWRRCGVRLGVSARRSRRRRSTRPTRATTSKARTRPRWRPTAAGVLEKLVRGDLLVAPEYTAHLQGHEDRRLRSTTAAGRPRRAACASSTRPAIATYRTDCHSGVINPENGGLDAIAVVACAAGPRRAEGAGKVFERVGQRHHPANMPQAEGSAPVGRRSPSTTSVEPSGL